MTRVGMASGEENLRERLAYWVTQGYTWYSVRGHGLTYDEALELEKTEAERVGAEWEAGGERTGRADYLVYRVSDNWEMGSRIPGQGMDRPRGWIRV